MDKCRAAPEIFSKELDSDFPHVAPIIEPETSGSAQVRLLAITMTAISALPWRATVA
jgi:hypothetical protein